MATEHTDTDVCGLCQLSPFRIKIISAACIVPRSDDRRQASMMTARVFVKNLGCEFERHLRCV